MGNVIDPAIVVVYLVIIQIQPVQRILQVALNGVSHKQWALLVLIPVL